MLLSLNSVFSSFLITLAWINLYFLLNSHPSSITKALYTLFYFFFLNYVAFKGKPAAHGGSQARG